VVAERAVLIIYGTRRMRYKREGALVAPPKST
jgi:hypothetical protein